MKAFNDEIESALLHSIDENIPLIVENDILDTAVVATLNQAGRPVAFSSCTLIPTERKYVSVEKEACAIVEAIEKWSHYLSARQFTIVTDQQAVMFYSEKLRKIKNNKIQRWRMELECYDYDIITRVKITSLMIHNQGWIVELWPVKKSYG